MLLEKTTLDTVPVNTNTWVSPRDILNNPLVSYCDGYLEEGLMDYKYVECSEEFIESMIKEGQKAPVLIEKCEGSYHVINGHHRLAVADFEGLPILVLITDGYGSWDESESDDYPSSQ